MEDDSGYVYEEESVEEQNTGGRGPFLTAVAILILVFVLAAGCSAVLLMGRDNASVDTDEIAIIETQNAIVAVTNAAVTQTIAAMETEAARPTDTPTPPPPTFTSEPKPTNTPRSTNTPVVIDTGDTDETTSEIVDGTPNVSGTSIFENETEDSTPTPIPIGGNEGGSLPDTGFELWAIVLAGVVLVGILAAARRMRSA